MNFTLKEMRYYQSDAKKYGISPAVILYNFRYWIYHNKIKKEKYHDGRYWVYYTIDQLDDLFPELTSKQIRLCIEKLVRLGAIKKGNYNKAKYDRTLWYSLNDQDEYFKSMGISSICPNGQMEMPKRANQFAQKGEPIPNDKQSNNKTTDDNSKPDANPVLVTQSQQSIEQGVIKNQSSFFKLIDIYNRYAKKSGLLKFELTAMNRNKIDIALKRLNLNENQFCEYLDKILSVPFLLGQNSDSWKITFDWMIKIENYNNIMRGKYDPRPNYSRVLDEIKSSIITYGRYNWPQAENNLSATALTVLKKIGPWSLVCDLKESVLIKKIKTVLIN